MPREIVRGDGREAFAVKIGWARDQGVQVGVEGDEGRSLLWLLYGNKLEALDEAVGEIIRAFQASPGESPGGLGACVLNALDVLSGFGERGYAGVWSDLDREGCNRLIRLVRKARDDAFGADA